MAAVGDNVTENPVHAVVLEGELQDAFFMTGIVHKAVDERSVKFIIL
jgi:hypothetical protein